MAGASSEDSGVLAAVAETTAAAEHLFVQPLTQGDSTAFWGVWEQYRTNLLARQSLHWMDGNHADAEDALSSSSLKACLYLTESTQDIRHMKGMLARLLHNHCMGVWRERQRQAKYLQGWMSSLRQDERSTTVMQESVEETLLRHEMAVLIQHALQHLPSRLREAAILRFVHELSYEEIAIRLHIRADNVRKRIQQTRTLLGEQLRRYCAAEPGLLASAPGLTALTTARLGAAPEISCLAHPEREEIIPASATLGALRVQLPEGGEEYLYLMLDHKPTRQQQKLETLRAYVLQHPHGWKKHRALADLLYTMGQWPEASAVYQQVVQQRPDCFAVWLRLGELWRLSHQDDAAITAYTHALSLASRDATRHHIEGLIALCRRQPGSATQAFAAATALAPDNPAHRHSLGLTHLHAAQPVAALQAFDEALQRNPDDLLALTYSPAALHAVGQATEAQRRATHALALDPTNVLALTSLTRHLSRTGQGRGASGQSLRSMVRRALQIAPDSPEVHESLARYHMFRGEWPQGTAVLQTYTQNHPGSPRGWYYAARWSFRSGAIPEAAAAILRAYTLDPHDAAILQAACTILLAADRLAEVTPLLHSMLQQFPEHWRVWTTAGYILLHGYEEKDQACTVAARGPHLQPQLAPAWFQCGRVLALAGRHHEAIAVLQQGWNWLPAGEGEAQALPAATWLGNSYAALGNPTEARKWWTQAIHLARQLRLSQPALACYWQGKALLALGLMANAHQSLHMALQQHLFYPARQEVQTILNRWEVEEKTGTFS
jgi:RNA polymerase sigma factor (sigma-70 family)